MSTTAQRRDIHMHRTVRVGVSMAQRYTVREAAVFMQLQSVPFEVALRTLTRPNQRRKQHESIC